MADDNVLARLQERIRLEGVAWLAPLVSSVSLPADPTVPQSTRPQRTARAPARLSPSPPAGGRRSTGKKAAKSRKAPLQGPPEQGHRRVSMAVRASAARGARLAQSEGTAAAAASGQCVSASPLDSGITAAAASSHSTSAPSACPPVPSVLPTAVGIPPPAPSPPPPPPGRLARWFGRVPKPSSAPVPPVPCTAAPPAGSPAGTAGQDSSSSEFFDVEPYSPPDEALSIRASTASVSRSQSRERRHSRRDRHATRSSSSSSSAESYKSAGRKRRRRTSHASGSHRPRSACREHEESRRHKRRYRRSPRHRRYSPSSVSSSGESRVRHSSHRRVRSRGSSRRSSRESRLERSSHTGSMLAPPTSSAPQPSVSNPGSAPLRVSEVESFQGAASSGTTGRSAMPSFSLGAGEHLRPLLESSLSDATWSSHGKAWEEWLACAAGLDWSHPMVCKQVTWTYLTNLRRAGVSAMVARKRLSGVSFMLRLWGLADSTKDLAVKLVLRGWKKEVVHRDKRRPISFSLLQQLIVSLRELCSSPYEVVVFQAAFSLAFFGALRVSELVALSKTKPSGLRLPDVVILPNSIKIFIRKSKTDIYAAGAWLAVNRLSGDYCPVHLVEEYVKIRPAQPETTLPQFLVHEDGSAVTKYQFESLFKKCLVAVGADPKEYGTHSFRIGAATVADALGMSGESVRRLGRWASDCYKRYVRPNLLSY
ncbi:pneumococcal serine-rich repeat protein-like isoform X1 [Dendropsophus ebraccatus]|uniref:pneumococcal serine-rich repeat protein-like isoform X1 n=1 Tax=Dendropsophus ebraccatus TaxID=150705 RepID=UPI003831B5F7